MSGIPQSGKSEIKCCNKHAAKTLTVKAPTKKFVNNQNFQYEVHFKDILGIILQLKGTFLNHPQNIKNIQTQSSIIM